LTLFGLFVAGMLFNFLDFKSESIYPSWLTHMFTNFAINTVGFILFGILPI
jgi:membrane protease YdiL (CAAX protease family)